MFLNTVYIIILCMINDLHIVTICIKQQSKQTITQRLLKCVQELLEHASKYTLQLSQKTCRNMRQHSSFRTYSGFSAVSPEIPMILMVTLQHVLPLFSPRAGNLYLRLLHVCNTDLGRHSRVITEALLMAH